MARGLSTVLEYMRRCKGGEGCSNCMSEKSCGGHDTCLWSSDRMECHQRFLRMLGKTFDLANGSNTTVWKDDPKLKPEL